MSALGRTKLLPLAPYDLCQPGQFYFNIFIDSSLADRTRTVTFLYHLM